MADPENPLIEHNKILLLSSALVIFYSIRNPNVTLFRLGVIGLIATTIAAPMQNFREDTSEFFGNIFVLMSLVVLMAALSGLNNSLTHTISRLAVGVCLILGFTTRMYEPGDFDKVYDEIKEVQDGIQSVVTENIFRLT